MGFFDLFKRERKQKYIVDKTPISNEYIESNFQFLIDSGYEYNFYQKYAEREFVYTLKECRVELLLDGYVFDCVIQIKDFPRANITQNPLVKEAFKERFWVATNQERIDMIINFLRENANVFFLK